MLSASCFWHRDMTEAIKPCAHASEVVWSDITAVTAAVTVDAIDSGERVCTLSFNSEVRPHDYNFILHLVSFLGRRNGTVWAIASRRCHFAHTVLTAEPNVCACYPKLNVGQMLMLAKC